MTKTPKTGTFKLPPVPEQVLGLSPTHDLFTHKEKVILHDLLLEYAKLCDVKEKTEVFRLHKKILHAKA